MGQLEPRIRRRGYVYLLVDPSGRKIRRYRAEHVIVWEQTNGKPLPKGWVVHHLNHVKDDNRPTNLAAMSWWTRKVHNRAEHKE